jgi:1,3-beta-glucan synthase
MQWSAVALGGAVSTIIMIFATITEFYYVPTTWNNTSHLARRFVFLLIVLAITTAPTIYIAIGTNRDHSYAPIIAYVQFGISAAFTLFFSIVPSARLFGDRVAGKARKYLANQTFTASYPDLESGARAASVALWLLIFACKLTESYFFLTLSFKNPIDAMVGMTVSVCNDTILGHSLCTHQPQFALTIMYIMGQ